ncbi:hypothetical protein [Microbacterium sp. KSW4-4]|uniref:hypothetical protein n=1 Tax=Microbacterium sp. KSW4-4 TaxID=2851651 RepID=UPI001FFCABF7|nr:hypothetical protein [Microbacterium sp. KSW4-4]MCK2031672.1 hypothetical protein [Microbacterium sp. KSW4-4]
MSGLHGARGADAPAPDSTGPWPPDLSTLIPDLTVALATGVFIGIVLYLYQRGIERRQKRILVERVSRRLVEPMLYVLQRPHYVPDYSALGVLSNKHRTTLDILENSELDDWHETSPTQLTRALVDTRTKLRDLEVDSQNVRDAVERWFRIHPAPPGTREWVVGYIRGAKEHELKLITKPLIKQPISAAVEDSLTSRLVKRHFASVRAAENRAFRSISELLEILIVEVRAQRGTRERSTAGGSRTGHAHGRLVAWLNEPLE